MCVYAFVSILNDCKTCGYIISRQGSIKELTVYFDATNEILFDHSIGFYMVTKLNINIQNASHNERKNVNKYKFHLKLDNFVRDTK